MAPNPPRGQVAELIAVFTDHARTPRLEYLPGLCPDVEPALVAAGFVPEQRLPVMTCFPAALQAPPVPEGIGLSLASGDVQLRQAAEAQNDAYGQPITTDHDIARLRRTIAAGGLVAVALDLSVGGSVGGGLCALPHDGISELAAIGVRASHRRRGIAAGLTALLTRACPAVDIAIPFLTPAGAAEERIYRSVGYRPVTSMLHISLPNNASAAAQGR